MNSLYAKSLKTINILKSDLEALEDNCKTCETNNNQTILSLQGMGFLNDL